MLISSIIRVKLTTHLFSLLKIIIAILKPLELYLHNFNNAAKSTEKD